MATVVRLAASTLVAFAHAQDLFLSSHADTCVKTDLVSGVCFSNGKNRIGDMPTMTTTDEAACCAACAANSACVSWTFWSGSNCNLFKTTTGKGSGSCVSGAPGLTPSPPSPPPGGGPVTPTPQGAPCTDCPNIIFSLTDDQDLELGGWDPMVQTQDLLQKRGATLSNFMIHTPICSPSRSETVSGRYFHNIKSKLAVPPSKVQPAATAHIDGSKYEGQAFPVLLRAQKGYNVGIFGKANFNIPGNEGFARYFQGAQLGYGNSWDDDENPPSYKYKAGKDEYATSLLGNKSVEWLMRPEIGGSENQGRPFFLYFAPHAPHTPATPAKWYEGACQAVTSPRLPNFNYTGPACNTTGAFHELVCAQPPFSQEEADHIDQLARRRCQCLMSVDDAHAAIHAAVVKLGLEKKTYWFVTSDHGYNLGHHGLPSNKFLLYDHALKIPMVIQGPGVPQGANLPVLATNVDLAPTWLGLAGIDTPGFVDGRSLVSTLIPDASLALPATQRHLQSRVLRADTRTPVAQRTEQFIQYYNQGPWAPSGNWDSLEKRTLDDYSNTYIGVHVMDPSLGSGHYKYGEYEYVCETERIEAKQCFSNIDMYEMFDLAADPYELHNIYDTAPADVKAELARRLRLHYPCLGVNCL